MSNPIALTDTDVPEPPRIPDNPKELSWLTPKYRIAEHGLYLKRLMKALADKSKTGPRNIALTGSYGSGKSSVLEGLLGKWRYHGVRISLSTINPANLPPSDASTALVEPLEARPADLTARQISNVIQKEIVKQILYRETRWKMSGSRFRRIEKFHWLAAIGRATVAAVVVGAVAYLANWTNRFEELLSGALFTSEWWLPWSVTVVALLSLAAIFLAMQRSLHGRVRIKALSAGSAQIELKEDESAFDRYLDEIVYFFSVSKCTVAIFEDLDRFQRIEIYEELRSLNVLLNSSRQLRKPVRFVYAMRDSLFEEIATITAQGREADATEAVQAADPLRDALEKLIESAADRAKFFDLVIPMVPFATLRTSLDLWMEEVPDSTLVSRHARRIAARHVHDMRLIRNVSNEFHVFSEELTKNRIGGLRPDEIFALMLYKNVYLDDFEGIRKGKSVLDVAERLRQDTITNTLFAWDAEDVEESDDNTANARRAAMASAAGAALMSSIREAHQTVGRALPPAITFKVGTDEFDSDEITDPTFWRRLETASWLLQVLYGSATPRTVRRGLAELTEMIGFDPSTVHWGDPNFAPPNLHSVELRDRLQRAELKNLLEDPTLLDEPQRVVLAETLRKLFKSDLVYELVAAGLIDQNFSLYVSRFYGRTVSAVAMNFILHVAQTGRFVPLAELNGTRDVDAVLTELGEDLLRTPAALNVNLFNALIEDPRLDRTLIELDRLNHAEDFLDLYLRVGTKPATLAARLAENWSGAYRFLSDEEHPKLEEFSSILDSALTSTRASVAYEPAPRLATLISSNLGSLPSFRSDDSLADPEALVSLFRSNNALIEDLTALSAKMRAAFVADGRFVVTPTNLETSLGSANQWSLDADIVEGVLSRLLTDLDRYLTALPRSIRVLTKQKRFEAMVARIFDEAGLDGLKKVLGRTSRSLLVNKLDKLPIEIWRELAEDRRIAPTPANLNQYRIQFGLDEAIARIMSSAAAPDTSDLSDSEARVLAVAILELHGIAPTKKVRYLNALGLEAPLTADEVGSVSGDVISYLAPAGLIADNAETYASLRTRPWPTRAAWIKRAPKFTTYVDEIKFTDMEMLEIFGGDLSVAKKMMIARAVASHPDPLSPTAATAFGRFLLAPNLGSLPASVLDGLARDGCDPDTMVKLLHQFQVKVPRLTDRLALMPRPWKDLSGRSAKKPLVPVSSHSLAILQRLKAANVVTSWGEPEKGYVRVQVRKVP